MVCISILMDEKLTKIAHNIEMFKGWDFSKITENGSMFSEQPSWSYKKIIADYIAKSSCLLDMGTGGGEFLLTVENLPEKTFATEGYQPNLIVARENLNPIGIDVKYIEDDIIPFPDKVFDLVINRHESYKPEEVFRVLKDDGIFITQQVGGDNDKEINFYLEAAEPEYSFWNLDYACRQLEDKFNIFDKRESFTKTHFNSLEALCYYLNAIPWQIPDFSFEKYDKQLTNIDKKISINRIYSVTCHRFLICAIKKEEK